MIEIRYPNGRMTIDPEQFFPTSDTRIRKLLKVVDLDPEHAEKVREEMAGYCEAKAAELMNGRRSLAQLWADEHQKDADLREPIRKLENEVKMLQRLKGIHRSRKNKSGAEDAAVRIKEAKAVLKAAKAEQRLHARVSKEAERDFLKAEPTAKKLTRNAEVIRG